MQESIKHWLLDGKIDAIICAVDEICYTALGAIEELNYIFLMILA